MRPAAGTMLVAIGFLLSSALAKAEPTAGDRAAAQTLFDSGLALMKDGHYAEACPKLQESQRLDPGIGTLFNLSDCYERTGRIASAWAGFREVADLARLEKQKKRELAAAARADALAPRLSTLTIEVQGSPATGLVVKRDGVEVGMGQWGTAVPVDPGEHEIEATSPGKQTVTRKVVVSRDAQAEVVSIPPLLDVEPAPAPPVLPTSAPPPAPAQPPDAPPNADHGTSGTLDSSSGSQRTWAYVLGGVGIVGMGASTVLAIQARSKYNASLDDCSTVDTNLCNATGKGLRDDARSSGTYATIAFGVGAAALAGGVALWLTAPSSDDARRRTGVRAAPMIGRDGGGLLVGGAF